MAVLERINGLRRLVSGPNLRAGQRRAVVIAVAAQKGGVGKTTTAVHLASGLARFHGRRVLLIEGHCATSLRADEGGHDAAEGSLGEVLLQKRRDVLEIARPTSQEGLFVVPSDRELNTTESLMSARIGKELLLRQSLSYARTHYDVIVVDCPPNLGSLTVNALVAADQVLVPCDLSLLSLDGVEALIDTLDTVQETLNPSLSILGLLRTRVDRRNQKVNGAIEATLSDHFGSLVLETDIGISTAITKAQLAGQPVFVHDGRSRAAKSYKSLCAEVIARISA